MTYTDEQMKMLYEALPHFKSARQGTIRNAPRWLTQQVIDIYEQATGKKIPNTNLSCAICVLHVYQIVGKTYFDDEKEREQQKNNETNTDGRDKNNIKRDAKPDSGDTKTKVRNTGKSKKRKKQE